MRDIKYIPLAFIAFTVFFMLLDFFFIGLAKRSYTGVYTENYYQKGVDFDKLNRQSIYSDKTGWKGNIVYDQETHEIKFFLRDNNDVPIQAERVYTKVMRPVTHEFDEILELAEVEAGEYRVLHEFLEYGQWEVRVKAVKENDNFIMSKRLVLMPSSRDRDVVD